MRNKPQNHVTRELGARSGYKGSPFPGLTKEQLDWLASNFPPRCYDHRAELIEDHLKYSGVVAFAQSLQAQWDERLDHTTNSIDADAEVAQSQP